MRVEQVALSTGGPDEAGPLGVGLDRLAKPEHVVVHGAGGLVLGVAPGLLEQALAAQDLARMVDEVGEEAELPAGQDLLPPSVVDFVTIEIDHDLPEAHP